MSQSIDTKPTHHSSGKTAKIHADGKQSADTEGGLAGVALPTIDPANPPSNKKVLEVLDTVSKSIDQEKRAPGQTSDVVLAAEDLVDGARDLTKKKNKGEHLQKAFEASARAVKDAQYTAGTPEERAKLAGARPQFRQNMPQLTRDIILQLLTDTEFRQSISSLLTLVRNIADADPSEDQHIPDNYHADPKKPATKSTAINTTDKEVVTTTTETVPIAEDRYEYHYTALTPDFRLKLANSLNSTLVAFGKSPKQSQAVLQMFDLFDLYHENIHPVAKSAHKENEDAATARKEMRKFATNFVEDKTLKDLLKRVRQFTRRLHDDADFRKWVGRMRRYSTRVMENPDRKLDSEKNQKRVFRLIDDGHRLMNQPKYRETVDGLSRDWQKLVDEIKDDKELNAFNKALQKMYDTLYITKKDGSATLDFNALLEMRGVFLSVLKTLLADFKLPTYEGSEGTYDFKLSNATLSVGDLVPDQITILHETEATMVMPKSEPAHKLTADDKSRMVGRLLVRAKGICAHIRDANFWYARNKFPKTEDSGIANMDLVGRGLDIEIEIFIKSVNGGKLEFQDGAVWVHIDKFKLKLEETKHHAFYTFFKSTIRSRVSQMLTQHIADMTADAASRIVGNLNGLMEKATPDKFASSFFSTIDQISPVGMPVLAHSK